MEAQPPSPERMTARVSPWGPVAGTSTSGRSFTLCGLAEAGGAGGAVSSAKAFLNWGIQWRCTEKPCPTLGSITTFAPPILSTKARVAGGLQTWSMVPWKATHGSGICGVGRKSTPGPLGSGV